MVLSIVDLHVAFQPLHCLGALAVQESSVVVTALVRLLLCLC